MSDQSLPNSAICPTTKQLSDWLDNTGEPSEDLSDHVVHCERCAGVLSTLSDDEGLQTLAKSPSMQSGNCYSAEPEFEQLQATLKNLSPLSDTPANVTSSLDQQAGRSTWPLVGQASTEQDSAPNYFDAPSPDLLNQQLPAGRFTVDQLIGAGGAGAVYLAFDHRLQREVAIKVLGRNSLRDRQRFLREARVLAELEHPNVVRIFDFGILSNPGPINEDAAGLQAERFYLVMEYVPGGQVSALPVDRPANNGNSTNRESDCTSSLSFGYLRLAALLATAADGLAAAHAKSLVHRDVKPGNLLLSADWKSLKVADFGLARFSDVEATQVTRTGDLLGTPAFMSPEQVTTYDVAASSDIYSLGATLYLLLTGISPFQGNTAAILRQVAETEPIPPHVLNPRVPVDLEIICLHAIEKSVSDRYASMTDFADDLRRFAANESIQARPITSATKAYRFLKRNPSFASVLFLAVALLVTLSLGGIGAAVVFARQNTRLKQSAEAESLAKNAAQESLRDAIEAADQLLLSVTEDTALLPRAPGSEEVARKLLTKAQDYYRRLLSGANAADKVSFDSARARAGLAQISLRLGDGEGVEKEAAAALELLDSLPDNVISSEQRAEVRAKTLGVLGKSLATRGNFDRATEAMNEAVKVCEQELLRTPEHEQLQFLLAESLRGRAVPMIMAGEFEDSKNSLMQARVILAKLLATSPDRHDYLRCAAGCESSLAVNLVRSEGYELAREHLVKANEILKRLERDGQLPIRLRGDFASNTVNLASVETNLGNHQRAQELFSQAEQEYQQLSLLEPGVVEHKYNEVLTTLNSGRVAVALGTIEEMLAKYRGLLPKMEALLATSPDSLEYLGTLGLIQGNTAVLLRMLNQLEESLLTLEASTKTLDRYAELVGRTPDSLYAVALNHYGVAKSTLGLNRIDAGLKAINQSKMTTSAILADHPDYLPARMHQVDEWMVECDLLLAAEPIDPAALLNSAEQALAVSTTLISDFDDLPEYQIAHGTILSTLGDARLLSGQLDAADKAVEAGIAHLYSLAKNQHDEELQNTSIREALMYNYLVQAEVAAVRLQKMLDDTKTQAGAGSESALATNALKARLAELAAKCREFGAIDSDLDFLPPTAAPF